MACVTGWMIYRMVNVGRPGFGYSTLEYPNGDAKWVVDVVRSSEKGSGVGCKCERNVPGVGNWSLGH